MAEKSVEDNSRNTVNSPTSGGNSLGGQASDMSGGTSGQSAEQGGVDSSLTQPSGAKRGFSWRVNPPDGRWIMFIIFLSLLVVCDYSFRYFISNKDLLVLNFLNYLDYFICFFFFVDVIWRFLAAENKWRFFYTWGWIDLLASIPYFHYLRFTKIFYLFYLIRGARSLGRVLGFLFASKVSTTLMFSAFLFVFSILVASICELYFERHIEGATIVTLQDSLWWALMIASTVGDTNNAPVTVPGMVVGAVLTVIGYGLFSLNAGLMASWIQNNISAVEKKENIN